MGSKARLYEKIWEERKHLSKKEDVLSTEKILTSKQKVGYSTGLRCPATTDPSLYFFT
jgi:hypothetical protein